MNIGSVRHTIQSAEWIPVTAARMLIGIFFCISGGTKLFVPAQFSLMERTITESHIPFPHFNAIFVSLVEFVCGGCLALGLLTPVCALMLACVMIVAIATNRISSIQSSGILARLDDFLYLPEVLYLIILFWLVFSGPGRYSIDGLIARRKN
jgi:putative oxidoreductase